MTLSLDTAYCSFGGEVEASSTPTICRLPDSRRHQLSAIALTMAIQDYGRTIHRSGTLLTLVVPFTGDAGMFWVRPNTFDSAPPRGNLNGNTMVLRVRGTTSIKKPYQRPSIRPWMTLLATWPGNEQVPTSSIRKLH